MHTHWPTLLVLQESTHGGFENPAWGLGTGMAWLAARRLRLMGGASRPKSASEGAHQNVDLLTEEPGLTCFLGLSSLCLMPPRSPAEIAIIWVTVTTYKPSWARAGSLRVRS